ncbi:MAG: sigma-70 family RNA polymerase sigma factor [Alphaproteobacteria bacterium]|nr:sigma-70 family RNA polymerase sigma factor [Alphaproteobacteria bacterium]
MTKPSLSDLLKRAAERDREAFRLLYAAIGPRVKGFVLARCREEGLAEEITQEVLLTVWRRADRYDAGRASAETWIFTIARNRVVDSLRHRRVVEADQRDPQFVPDPPESLDAVVDAQKRAERIGAALDELPEAQREVLVQSFYEALSYPEIAEREGVALGTVKSRARLAFQRLRAILAGEDEP